MYNIETVFDMRVHMELFFAWAECSLLAVNTDGYCDLLCMC